MKKKRKKHIWKSIKKRKSNKRVFKRNIILGVLSVILLLLIVYLYLRTGFFSGSSIDKSDLEHWEYEDGLIKESQKFEIDGNTSTCWLMVHGFTDTPRYFNELALMINKEFGDKVVVPRLLGHGEVPSKIIGLRFSDWYGQVEEEFLVLDEKCENINLVGSSIGGAISLKLAQNYEFKNLYLLNPLIRLKHEWWYGFTNEFYINLFGDLFKFKKKIRFHINDKKGNNDHIGYFVTPLVALKKSFDDIKTVENNLDKVDEKVLIQQSINDQIVDMKSSEIVYEKIISRDKEIKFFERSDHLILRDYEKEDVIENIIVFEKQRR